jgi:hypothetical protein
MKPLGSILLVMMSFTILSYGLMGATNAQTPTSVPPLSVKTDLPLYTDGNTVTVTGFIKNLNPDYPVDLTLLVRDPTGNLVYISQITPKADGNFETTFITSGTFKVGGEYTIQASYSGQKASAKFNFVGGEEYTAPPPPPTPHPQEPEPEPTPEPEPEPTPEPEPEPTPEPEPEPTPTCGPGTHLENGKCVPDEKEPAGGGCLIATAAFGSELAPQVQMLREIRDNTVLSTSSGMAFMSGFNEFYYSFSPTIADWERENPTFQEAVRITITPLLTSLSILNYVDIDSEAEMLGYGISLIVLNLGMYIVVPAIVIIKLKNRFSF